MKEQITNLGQAVSILVQAAEFAQTKGVFNLKDATLLGEAISFIEVLNNPQQKTEETTTEA